MNKAHFETENQDANYHKTDNATFDFSRMIENSWTFNRMTYEEQANLWETLYQANIMNAIKGAYKTRWCILQAIYRAFLSGLGYNGFKWRSQEQEPF